MSEQAFDSFVCAIVHEAYDVKLGRYLDDRSGAAEVARRTLPAKYGQVVEIMFDLGWARSVPATGDLVDTCKRARDVLGEKANGIAFAVLEALRRTPNPDP